MTDYFDIAFTPAILDLQELKGSRGNYPPAGEGEVDEPHALDTPEVEMLTTRDSFYLASVSETGWPYVQHRGGEAGFVKVVDARTIGWIERSGNRQYLGTGNITATSRVAAIFMDYPRRTRLKLFGLATHHPDPGPELISRLGGDGLRVDGAITLEVLATDWNCPKNITPRYTADQVTRATEQLQDRIDELEAELRALASG